jgi:surface protein
MFQYATSFNQPIGTWNTTNVTSMQSMFNEATSFNQPLDNWDISSVTDLYFMFKGASAFNQTLENWNLTNVTNIYYTLSFSGMDCFHYSSTLIGWANNSNTPSSLILGADGRQYGTNALIARNNLINNKSWTFLLDFPSNSDCSQPCVATSSTISVTSCGQYTAPNGTVYTVGGQYTVTIQNTVGCDSIITINLTIPAFNTSVTLNGVTLAASLAGATYQWVECSGFQNIPGQTGQSFTPTASGAYAVLITYQGCTYQSNCTTVQVTGTNQLFSENRLVIYPNPTDDILYLKLGENSGFEVFTIEGVLIEKISESQLNHTLNCSLYPAGLYYIRAGGQTQRFVKK